MAREATWRPTEGKRAWSTVFETNVDVLRIYKTTATVHVWGEGPLEGKILTMRGQRLSSLDAPRSPRARGAAAVP